MAPWYLVWDNVIHQSLQADGATYWPYQVTKVGLIDAPSKAKLFPSMLPERYKRGAELTEKYCLACHQVNGVGGREARGELQRVAGLRITIGTDGEADGLLRGLGEILG